MNSYNPFLVIVKELFEFFFKISNNNHVLSLILLSISIKLIIYPLEILIKRITCRGDEEKEKILDRINEIKECYKGQIRGYYLKTLYRQNNIKWYVDHVSTFITLCEQYLYNGYWYYSLYI